MRSLLRWVAWTSEGWPSSGTQPWVFPMNLCPLWPEAAALALLTLRWWVVRRPASVVVLLLLHRFHRFQWFNICLWGGLRHRYPSIPMRTNTPAPLPAGQAAKFALLILKVFCCWPHFSASSHFFLLSVIYVGPLCGRGTSACSAVAFLRLTSSIPSALSPPPPGPLCNWNSKSFLVWQFCKRNCRCLVFLRFHFRRWLFLCRAVIRRKCFPLFPPVRGSQLAWVFASMRRVLPALQLLSNFVGVFLRRVNRVDILRWEFRFPLQFSLSRCEFSTLFPFFPHSCCISEFITMEEVLKL